MPVIRADRVPEDDPDLVSLATAAGLDDRLGPFVALYVLTLAVASPLLASRAEVFARVIPQRACPTPA